jgi:amidophosphoribosyltransferase
MCGIVGIVGTAPVNQRIYDALTVLQHRGQDAAGIMTMDDRALFVHKDNGLVRDVFRERDMRQLTGNAGIGHVRYPTAGSDGADEAQPFYVNAPFGIGLGHNGNLINAGELSQMMIAEDRRHLNTRSDSEVLLNVFASELQRSTASRPTASDVFRALETVFHRCRGGYAVVALVVGNGVVGFRDPHGIRPLVLGRRETPRGPEWMLASESVALDMLDFELVRDVGPGEGSSSTCRAGCTPANAPPPPNTPPASSSTCISPGRTRSSTTSRCTRRACGWARSCPKRLRG